MSKNNVLVAIIAVSFAAPLGFADSASAAKKKKATNVTYEQAWKICKDNLDKAGVWGTGLQANERAIRATGCMKKYGYRI